MLAVFCGTTTCMFLFGGIASLLCLRFSKVAVIVGNMVIVILMSIYNTVATAVKQDPRTKLDEQHKYTYLGYSYFDRNFRAREANSFTSITENIEDYFATLSLDKQKEI